MGNSNFDMYLDAAQLKEKFGISEKELLALRERETIGRETGKDGVNRYSLRTLLPNYQKTVVAQEISQYLRGPSETPMSRYITPEDQATLARLKDAKRVAGYNKASSPQAQVQEASETLVHPAVILGILAGIRKTQQQSGLEAATTDEIVAATLQFSPRFYSIVSRDDFDNAIELLKYRGGAYKGGVIRKEIKNGQEVYVILSSADQKPQMQSPQQKASLDEKLRNRP